MDCGRSQAHIQRVGLMKRYYVDYYPNQYDNLVRHIYLYAYSSEQVREIMADYNVITVDQTD